MSKREQARSLAMLLIDDIRADIRIGHTATALATLDELNGYVQRAVCTCRE